MRKCGKAEIANHVWNLESCMKDGFSRLQCFLLVRARMKREPCAFLFRLSSMVKEDKEECNG